MRIPLLGVALLSSAFFVSVADAAVLVTVDKSTQHMTVSVDGQPRYTWPVSTGKGGYDTPAGKFKAFRMERDHFSKEWDDAPMPHSIFFTQKGHAIHGSFDTKRLGSPASHGCVRLSPANAKTLFQLVEREGVLNTTVVLTGTLPSGPAMAKRRAPSASEEQQVYQQPYGQPQQYGTSAYGNPYYSQQYQQQQPTYAQPRYAQPQYGQPQYVQPQYGQPQYVQPARPNPLPRPGYVYRDPYAEPAYRPRGSLFGYE
jgi:hypothetical protein